MACVRWGARGPAGPPPRGALRRAAAQAWAHASTNSMPMAVAAMLLLALARPAASFTHGTITSWGPGHPLRALEAGGACARPPRGVEGARPRAAPMRARGPAAARMSEDVYRDLGQDMLSRSHTSGSNKMWLLLPEVFVLLSTRTPAAATERAICKRCPPPLPPPCPRASTGPQT